ncbi:hypothetical protein J437_LFUL010643 [Ladona fulva]|uniref:Reverse transcriptase/retrotransposon-derived protein RNase H-like domain-containing protein n=1 Tax=Ladona fulva TaxID=123851 RepID=A0A8K0PBX4_LADFU|nr:hypothetical protein J437_LFUL010643 [Ladona fulva]
MAEAIAKRLCKFSFHGLDKENSTWDSYIFQFEQMCRVKGLGDADIEMANARRELLLAYVAAEHLEALRNFSQTSKRQKWEWTEVHEQAFQKAKDLLPSQATVVPYDETRPLVLACDASERGVGAVLFQTMAVGLSGGRGG